MCHRLSTPLLHLLDRDGVFLTNVGTFTRDKQGALREAEADRLVLKRFVFLVFTISPTKVSSREF